MNNYIQNIFADRIGGKNFGKDTKIYKFEKIKRAKREAQEKNPGIKLIDMGVGEPDEMAFPIVIETLQKEAMKKTNRGYTDNGIDLFKNSASQYMKSVFNVDIDQNTEINHSIGSKVALAMIPHAFINPGDITLLTSPGYPVLGTLTEYLGGVVYKLPLYKEKSFLPELDSIPEEILKKAKLLYLNYPNNPTGAIASEEFYIKALEFAKRNNILIVSDAAYISLTYDTEPLSILSISGAKDTAIELHSMSKGFNMTGWRISWVCGNSLAVKAFATIKDNHDSGQFAAIQIAAAAGLEHPEITKNILNKYKRRMKMLVQGLKEIGFKTEMPGGTFYLYTEAPIGTKSGIKFNSAEDFSQYLIRDKLISTVPWDDVGHFVRFSVTYEANSEHDEKKIIEEIIKRLSDTEFIWRN